MTLSVTRNGLDVPDAVRSTLTDDDVAARLDGLLARVKDDEDARQEYVDLLEMLGADDPRTPQYRRALASRLY